MHYRMSMIYGHPVIAVTRALRFANHVTPKETEGRSWVLERYMRLW